MSMPAGAEAGRRGPGARSRALEERRRKAVARGVATMTPVYAAAAHGAVLEDVDGNRFIDFTGGLGVLNAGHTPPSVVQAVKDQVERYLHTCQHAVMNEPYVAVAEALNRITPGDYDKRTMLVNSGRRGDRERGQDRPRRHRPPGRGRVRQRLPRPHPAGPGHDRQGDPVQAGLPAVPERGLPGPLRLLLPLPVPPQPTPTAASPAPTTPRRRSRSTSAPRTWPA